MSNFIKIPAARWEKDLKEILDKDFDSDLPDPRHADIYGSYDEKGKIEAFIITEKIVMIGQIWVRSDTSQNNGQKAKKLLSFIQQKMPLGISIGAVASEERFEGLFRLFRMHKIAGKFFRRNL